MMKFIRHGRQYSTYMHTIQIIKDEVKKTYAKKLKRCPHVPDGRCEQPQHVSESQSTSSTAVVRSTGETECDEHVYRLLDIADKTSDVSGVQSML